MLFAALYAIVVGFGMIAQWGVMIARGQVAGPEAGALVGRGEVEMSFHWVAEFLTAVSLIVSGTGLLLNWPWSRSFYLFAMGMLLYTIIVSPGYFAEKREWPMVIMFAILFILALVSLAIVL